MTICDNVECPCLHECIYVCVVGALIIIMYIYVLQSCYEAVSFYNYSIYVRLNNVIARIMHLRRRFQLQRCSLVTIQGVHIYVCNANCSEIQQCSKTGSRISHNVDMVVLLVCREKCVNELNMYCIFMRAHT